MEAGNLRKTVDKHEIIFRQAGFDLLRLVRTREIGMIDTEQISDIKDFTYLSDFRLLISDVESIWGH